MRRTPLPRRRASSRSGALSALSRPTFPGSRNGVAVDAEQPKQPRRGRAELSIRPREYVTDVGGLVTAVQRVQWRIGRAQLRGQGRERLVRAGGGPRGGNGQRQRKPCAQSDELGRGCRLALDPPAPSRPVSSLRASCSVSRPRMHTNSPARTAKTARSARCLAAGTGTAALPTRTCTDPGKPIHIGVPAHFPRRSAPQIQRFPKATVLSPASTGQKSAAPSVGSCLSPN
jgi:hypothetical protein